MDMTKLLPESAGERSSATSGQLLSTEYPVKQKTYIKEEDTPISQKVKPENIVDLEKSESLSSTAITSTGSSNSVGQFETLSFGVDNIALDVGTVCDTRLSTNEYDQEPVESMVIDSTSSAVLGGNIGPGVTAAMPDKSEKCMSPLTDTCEDVGQGTMEPTDQVVTN